MPLLDSTEAINYQVLKINVDNIYMSNGILNPEIELQMRLPDDLHYNKGEFVFYYLFEKYPELF